MPINRQSEQPTLSYRVGPLYGEDSESDENKFKYKTLKENHYDYNK